MKTLHRLRGRLHLQKGLSLLEVLAFVTILSIVFLGIASSTIQSIKRTKFTEQKLIATRYAEELEEWLRGQKEEDWTTFYNTRSSISGKTYCFDDKVYDQNNDISWPSLGACGSTYNLKGLFKREVLLTRSLSTQVQVVISVSWKDGANIFSVPLNTLFAKWE